MATMIEKRQGQNQDKKRHDGTENPFDEAKDLGLTKTLRQKSKSLD
jgi:hypothetical protein